MKSLLHSSIRYVADLDDHKFFFTEKLQTVIAHIAQKVSSQAKLWVYPDATIKSNLLPTGIAYIDRQSEALLFPYILRDPGCGYLTFKIEFDDAVTEKTQLAVGQLIDYIVNSTHKNPLKNARTTPDLLNGFLYEGINALTMPEKDYAGFMFTSFPVDKQKVQPTAEELSMLADDFMVVTNTVEIRKVFDIKQPELLQNQNINEYIGFIHTGSDIFPEILGKRFMYDVAMYAFENDLASAEDIKQGTYAVHANSDLGDLYYNWLQAAMNYALVSRYSFFQFLKEQLEENIACKITLINDNPHAGVFKKMIDGIPHLYTTRGVQHIFNKKQAVERHALSLIAGQRETIAALVTGGTSADVNFNLFSHGTGYEILKNYPYKNGFSELHQELYSLYAGQAFYNTVPEIETFFAYTHNLQKSLDYFEVINLVETIAYLAPWVNIYSKLLKNNI